MSDYREEKKEDGESLLNENNNTNNEVRNNEYDQVLVADETNKQNANLSLKQIRLYRRTIFDFLKTWKSILSGFIALMTGRINQSFIFEEV